MSAASHPLAYVLLGTPGSGRREILADLIADGVGPEGRALTLLAATEAPSEFDAKLGEVRLWYWEDAAIRVELPPGIEDASDSSAASAARPTHVFFMVDGRRDPVDQLEAIKAWLQPLDLELARVITVVDCHLASTQPALAPWFDACVHFSDVVLLARREGVENRWMSDFQRRYRDQFIPALFEFVKGGRVKNPALVLEPQPRRMTQVFDESDVDLDVARSLAPEADILFSGEGNAEDDEEFGDEAGPEGLDEALESAKEKYFERKANGQRVITLPDVRKYLGDGASA